MRLSFSVFALLLLGSTLSACSYIPTWMGGEPSLDAQKTEEKSDEIPSKEEAPAAARVEVILGLTALKADPLVADQPISIPDQVTLYEWPHRNAAMQTPHISLSGLSEETSVTIGEGNDFSGATAPTPVIVDHTVLVMDGAGVVSAHASKDISDIRWTSDAAVTEDGDAVFGGGMAVSGGVVFAATGNGTLVALDFKTGKMLWKTSAGAPVRGAPAVAEDAQMVIVLTADNQTLAFSTAKGEPRWSHRGIRESAGYYSATSPVIDQGIVVTCYSSGEMFALRTETGSVLWTDTLTNTVRTSAAAMFSGIDADPIVQDGVVVTTSASSEMQASVLRNGRPLWQARVGSHSTPWSAGNVLYALSSTHDLVALFKRDGAIRWVTPLGTMDDQQKDTTPALFGPILAGDAVLVMAGDGTLRSFHPETGKLLGTFDIAMDTASQPVIADGALYLVTKDAQLYRYAGE